MDPQIFWLPDACSLPVAGGRCYRHIRVCQPSVENFFSRRLHLVQVSRKLIPVRGGGILSCVFRLSTAVENQILFSQDREKHAGKTLPITFPLSICRADFYCRQRQTFELNFRITSDRDECAAVQITLAISRLRFAVLATASLKYTVNVTSGSPELKIIRSTFFN
jgi:hypothetical protein